MLGVFQNAWKVPEIRKKLFFIVMMLAVYRIGSHIVLPGLFPPDPDAAAGNVAILMIMMGGNPGTVFAMGIQPYITASIIMQLLTVAIPALERMKKEGEEGRKKINQITRISAIGLAFVQGAATVFSLSRAPIGQGFMPGYNNLFVWSVAVVAIVTGTMFIMWIGELITEKGIGNGTSFIITANILANLPRAFWYLWSVATISVFYGFVIFIILIIFVAVVAFTVLVQEGERRLPVQYSKKMVGKQLYGGQTSHIPVKVNIAGVMSIIFASALLGIPQLLVGFAPNNLTLQNIMPWFHPGYVQGIFPTGPIAYVVLIFAFTFFYTSFSVNPVEMAENLKKNGGAIPGVRSGKPTAEYIQRTVTRMSWIGACTYSVIALVPVVVEFITAAFGDPITIGFGGTTILIVVGVGLELVKQMESQLLTRHYKGFLS